MRKLRKSQVKGTKGKREMKKRKGRARIKDEKTHDAS